MNAPFDIQQIAASEIAPEGERLVWCGQPDPYRLASTMLPIFLFALPWTAFALFWMYAAAGFRMPADFAEGTFPYFSLFGIPFVLIGAGMLFAPLYMYVKAFQTVYVVTDKTLRIITAGRMKKVETYTANDIRKIVRMERPDGRGDVVFKQDVTYDSRRKRKVSQAGFFGIADVREVERHIIHLRQSAQEHTDDNV